MDTIITRREAMKLTGAAALLAVAEGCGAGLGTSAMGDEAPGPATAAAIGGTATAGGEYALPPLPYAYDALEPLYEARTLQIHHDKHHAGYVKGLNATLAALALARQAADYSQVKALSRDLAFHGSGHVLHSLFWRSMAPGGRPAPSLLEAAMKSSFGSPEAAMAQFQAATNAVEASGWGVLAWEPMGRRLVILQAEKHQDLTIWGVVPLLVCDVWEHAYYLQFANRRDEWVASFMKLADWSFAGERLAAAIGEADH